MCDDEHLASDLQGRTPKHVSDSERAAAICLGGIVACLLVAGIFCAVRVIWKMM